MQTRDNLRKQFAEFDNLENESSWPSAEKSLKEAYYKALKISLKEDLIILLGSNFIAEELMDLN